MVTDSDLTGGHGDAVPYVLGALDAAARERFESHAGACPECLNELDELRPVADRLGLAAPQVDPPPALEQRLIARARQLTPAARGATAGAATGAAVPLPSPVPLRRGRGWPPGSWAERLAGTFAAAAMGVALLSAGYAAAAHQEVQRTSSAAAQLAETLAIMYQPGRVSRELSSDAWPAAKGMIYMVPGGQDALVVTYDLPRLARQEIYQFWLGNPEQDQRISGGVFNVDERGRGRLIVRTPATLSQYRSCGVTKEPAQGSPKPTGPRMLSGSL